MITKFDIVNVDIVKMKLSRSDKTNVKNIIEGFYDVNLGEG